MNKIIFCDTSKEFENQINNQFINKIETKNKRNIEIVTCTNDIQNIRGNNFAYFSPANSFLFFDGGIDAIYSKMFGKNLQCNAQKIIRNYDMKTTLGRNYLPIGSSLVINVDHKFNTYIIACPTMFRPQDIRGTRNVYYAFLAGLLLIDKFNMHQNNDRQIKTLVCPGLGTGYGKISFQESTEK
jgi:O-acetyl-ADP-ribose deacetylase (regulator of RNase III)